MDNYTPRKKKADKAKEKFEKFGKNTNKHIRAVTKFVENKKQ
jgi:hypothetical protein